MENYTTWILGLIYWLHMMATVAWLGSLAALVMLILPAARQVLDDEMHSLYLRKIRNRIQQIGWLSLVILIATGMFQMSSNPNYGGFLAINNPWAVAIFAKHLMIGVMMAIGGYISLWVNPALERSLIHARAGNNTMTGIVKKLEIREMQLLQINLIVSIIVLALTAWARAS